MKITFQAGVSFNVFYGKGIQRVLGIIMASKD